VDVGVTKYSTVPDTELLTLVKVCDIIGPVPADAPVILDDTLPNVHAKVDGAVAVNVISGDVLLQIATVLGTPVICGVGLTVTVIKYGELVLQFPPVEVGVTKYSTVPDVLLLLLVNVCAIVDPLPELAPLMLPLTLPNVQLKVLGAVAFNGMLVAVLLQIATVAGTPVICGVGLTVTVILKESPIHPPAIEVGTTMYSTVPAVLLLLFIRV
jgi:hypothetical protein